MKVIRRYAAFVLRNGGGLFRAARFLVRGALQRRVMTEFLDFLDQTPLAADPSLLRNVAEKVFREFCRRRYGVADRARLLIDHYRLLMERTRPEALHALVSTRGVVLARLDGRRGGSYEALFTVDSFRKEGEAAIRLIDLTIDAPLATVSFTLTRGGAGEVGISIGGLQGPRAHIGKAAVVGATRDLSGLRPKAAVIEALYALADRLDARIITAASKDTHVSRGNAKKERETFADLDAFWEELGGERTPDGDFRLPAALFHRDPADVPAKRRKEWLAKRAHIEALEVGTRSALDGMARVD